MVAPLPREPIHWLPAALTAFVLATATVLAGLAQSSGSIVVRGLAMLFAVAGVAVIVVAFRSRG